MAKNSHSYFQSLVNGNGDLGGNNPSNTFPYVSTEGLEKWNIHRGCVLCTTFSSAAVYPVHALKTRSWPVKDRSLYP